MRTNRSQSRCSSWLWAASRRSKTGTALQDAAAAALVNEKALTAGLGVLMNFSA